ncbi:MAG: adenylate/guanylate cyclase domain-containing protein [Chloroflexi bacterium]|jgi:adenylate cyclase|nr:adenylate/guanylate cyclase domain-containing protein [Chloroflexota bacterium]MBT3670171.1 adenylate/guanylate cyclase domain-containing protein [Chloroflexota bacterium]MBT4004041.1 adenylate/guanylate cyclase domain-containing protein [Chloroflexota bacterium]MBT4306155.1 adenylate/guanylate cyclase domain-containing protein [Chloroflexota bacterium]MBT4534535.1 adenylate/guanylate cyclase domain-containing protein [Chloroflexota bacterium]
MYFIINEPIPGAIPFSYGIVSSINIIYFGITGKYRFFRFNQLALTLLLPFFLMITLGGFINGSAVIFWALVSPLGAMLFDELRNAFKWFIAFLILLFISGFLQPIVHIPNNLSTGAINFFFVLNILGVSSLVFWMVYYFITQKDVFQLRSESLLLNILPKDIAAILKQDQEQDIIADQFDAASVLFADLVGFTPLSATMAPVEMVELLNEVFSYFDSLLEKYGVEKIRTIGDSYMVASGVPKPREDHALAIAQMGLDMREYISNFESDKGQKIGFRFGINSGPVVAGVIGRKKFVYAVWGDTVNVASRMESHGSSGNIQISQATQELIKDSFLCGPQGKVNIKGKGEMPVWYVLGKKNSA